MDIKFLGLFIMQRMLCSLISALNIKFRYHLAIWKIGKKGMEAIFTKFVQPEETLEVWRNRSWRVPLLH